MLFHMLNIKCPGDEFHRYSNTGLKLWSNQFKERKHLSKINYQRISGDGSNLFNHFNKHTQIRYLLELWLQNWWIFHDERIFQYKANLYISLKFCKDSKFLKRFVMEEKVLSTTVWKHLNIALRSKTVV